MLLLELVGGGTGADTINVAGTLGVVSGQIFGGGDADSIYAGSVASGIDASLVSIYGGAGADTITISGQADIASGSQFATLAYSSLSESTLGSVDLFQVVSGTTSGAANGNISVPSQWMSPSAAMQFSVQSPLVSQPSVLAMPHPSPRSMPTVLQLGKVI